MIFTEAFTEINPSCFNPHSSTSSRDTSFSNHLCSYQDIIIIDKLEKARFPIFLVYSPSVNKHFAMKVFPWNDDKISSYYLNEVIFTSISHQNIISVVATEFKHHAMLGDSMKTISYTLMEYAPYGDFYDLLMTTKVPFDEKLVRTYLHQLMEGLEHIHLNGVAHLDLKLENLLLGDDFQLKIADFDHAYIKGQSPIYTKGTICYRAPEMIKDDCSDSEAADVYSAGVILFLFKTGGMLPHCEQNCYQGKNLFELLNGNNPSFWDAHCQIQNKDFKFFDKDFRELFNAMTKFDPSKRAKISDVKSSPWYNGPIYSKYEVKSIMQNFFGGGFECE